MKTNRGIYWALMCTFMAIITIVCGLTIVESAKVATLRLEQTVTYDAPAEVEVTFDAGEGSFGSTSTYVSHITFGILTSSDNLLPATDPTRNGYSFNGWEYSTDGTNYSDYTSSSIMSFTEHLYFRAKWEEISTVIVGFFNPGSLSSVFTYQITDANVTTPTGTWHRFDIDYSRETGTFLDDLSGNELLWTSLEAGQKIFIRYGGGLERFGLFYYDDTTTPLWSGNGSASIYSIIVTENIAFDITARF